MRKKPSKRAKPPRSAARQTAKDRLNLHLSSYVWLVAYYGVCLLALWRGGRDERWTAVVLTLVLWGNQLRHPMPGWHGIDPVIAVLDLALLIYLLRLALVSHAFWPLWATAAQLGNVLGAIPYLLSERTWTRTYNLVSVIWSYGVILSLAAGVLLERRPIGENGAGGRR